MSLARSCSIDKSLAQKFEKISLSVNYDCITIYYHHLAAHEYEFFFACLTEMQALTHFNRLITIPNEDHTFYHDDDLFNYKRWVPNHVHLKFNIQITYQLLTNVLVLFIPSGLLSESNKEQFLAMFDKRYELLHAEIQTCLTQNKHQDYLTILTYIKSCSQNDVLANLHRYFSSPAFVYLRQGEELKTFLGTNELGEIVATTHEWAMLEKAIALQMQVNIKNGVKRFSSLLGEMYGDELANNHAFFKMKRKLADGRVIESKNFKAFHAGNGELVEKTYQKFFK